MQSKLSDAKKIYVSFSGGADSTALLLRAYTIFPDKLEAIHFEHGLRGPESIADAVFCERFCAERQIPFRMIPLNVPENRNPGEGDEEAARRLRLAAWQKIVTEPETDVVLLGHHAGDAVETLLLRLFRGSNVSGLAALRQERRINGIRFLRPQLDLTRDEIEQYLNENGITEWCHDRTNDDTAYLRNYLRNKFLPELADHAPYATGGMLRAIKTLSDDADLLEQLADNAFERCKNGDRKEWQALHPALLARVLRRFTGSVPGHTALERLTAELKKKTNGTTLIPLGNGITLKLSGNSLSVATQNEPESEMVWHWREEPVCKNLSCTLLPREQVTDLTDGAAYFDAEELPEFLIRGPWREGDTILSFDDREKNLKKLFCDAHITAPDRFVLRGPDGSVFLVPGLRNSALAKVTARTKTVVRITLLS